MYLFPPVVTLYDCGAIGTSCSSCISPLIPAKFNCVWCTSEECGVQDEACNEYLTRGETGDCDAPEIKSVSLNPLSVTGIKL